jgi:hypothetical protein
VYNLNVDILTAVDSIKNHLEKMKTHGLLYEINGIIAIPQRNSDSKINSTFLGRLMF